MLPFQEIWMQNRGQKQVSNFGAQTLQVTVFYQCKFIIPLEVDAFIDTFNSIGNPFTKYSGGLLPLGSKPPCPLM